MTPIVRTIDGKSYTFALTAAALTNATWGLFPIGGDGDYHASSPKFLLDNVTTITPASFVAAIRSTPVCQSTDIPADTIRRVLAAALWLGAGGDLPSVDRLSTTRGRLDDYPATIDLAGRFVKDSNNRAAEFLAADIVAAALAVGQ
jgi:hypothetical protein